MIDLTFYIMIPILSGALLYLFSGEKMKRLALSLHLLLFAASVHGFFYIKNHGPLLRGIGPWGTNGILLRADMISMTLLMLTSFMFLMMVLYEYNSYYTNNLYMFLFIILQSLISAIFLTSDLFNVFVLIEVATINVSILIMFKQDRQSVYDGIVYMLVNIVAMNFFLFGLAFIYRTFGSLDMGVIGSRMHLVKSPLSLIVPYALMMTAVGLKSAIMPLFSWLPKAHGTPSAPSAVSAILSGLYVKTGVYLFVRLNTMFGGAIDASSFLVIVGFITGVVGFILAISQTDIKLILAYSTISQIGLIMVGLNYPSDYSYWGGVYHIMNHAFFKATLFLATGIMTDHYGTRDISQIRGVIKSMPVVAWASIMAVLGITGAPFFNGSISKYLIQTGMMGSLFEWGVLFINLGTIICFINYCSIFTKCKEEVKVPKAKIDFFKQLTVLIMGTMCLVGGIWGQRLIYLLFDQVKNIGILSQLEKSIYFLASLVIGYIFYKQFVLKTRLFTHINGFELDFNDICLSLTGFTVSVVIYLLIVVS